MTDNSFEPPWISPPGATIEDILEDKGWTKREFARRTGYTEKHISQLTSGDASLTEEAALRLEKVLGGTARFWLAREAQYREALARVAADEALASEVDWLDQLPIADMVRQRWIPKTRDKLQRMRDCLRYFGVASVDAWRQQYAEPLAAFRASGRHTMRPGAVAAWIRRGETAAEGIVCHPWDERRFKRTVQALRDLALCENPAEFLPELERRCAECGVAVVVEPAPRGCPAFGMTKWLTPDKALLMLSLRYKTHDHLWFTFFHEAAHLLLHGKRLMFIEGLDGLDDELETQADRFAADLLIPEDAAKELAKLTNDRTAITAFARTHAVHPGIVVGRMQREKRLRYDQCNDLKVRYDWE